MEQNAKDYYGGPGFFCAGIAGVFVAGILVIVGGILQFQGVVDFTALLR